MNVDEAVTLTQDRLAREDGIIKEVVVFRRLHLRGLEAVRGERTGARVPLAAPPPRAAAGNTADSGPVAQ